MARIAMKPMYYVTRTESGFGAPIMRFSARTANCRLTLLSSQVASPQRRGLVSCVDHHGRLAG
jgi:hypothetical protein